MGLGKATRGGGKLAAALQVSVALWGIGAAIVARVRGKRVDEAYDDAVRRDEAPPVT